MSTAFVYWLNIVTTDREQGNEFARAIGNEGDEFTFDDENCLLLSGGARGSALPISADTRTLALSIIGQYPAVTIQDGSRDSLENTLPAWVASMGYETIPKGEGIYDG